MWSYDSPARDGLQYPLSLGARGKYGEKDPTNDSRAGVRRIMSCEHKTNPARLAEPTAFAVEGFPRQEGTSMQKTTMCREGPATSYKEVKIGKTIYRVTSIFSGEKDLGTTLEELALRRAAAVLAERAAQ